MKKIGKFELFSVALGSVIGWGAFMLPGNLFLPEAGVINTAVGFTVAVLMIAVIEKNYSLLMRKYKTFGGEYSFAKGEFGNRIGFSTGWFLLLAYISIIPLNASAIPLVVEKVLPFYEKGLLLYSVAGFPVYLHDLLLSCLAVLLFSYSQLRGLSYSTIIQNLCVSFLLGSIVIIFIFALLNSDPVHYKNLDSNMGELDMKAIIRIIAFAPWAFIGFDTIAQITSESKVSTKVASRMALLAVVVGGIVYNLLNVVTGFGLDNQALIGNTWATGQAVYNIMGPTAMFLVGLAMFGAVLSGLNGFFISSTRLTVKMASDTRIKQLSFKRAILFVTFISLIVPFFGRNALFWFVDISSVGASFAYLVTSAAAFRLSENSIQRAISVLGVMFSILFLVFLLTPFFDSNIPFISFIVLLIWCGLGFLFYQVFYKKFASTNSINSRA